MGNADRLWGGGGGGVEGIDGEDQGRLHGLIMIDSGRSRNAALSLLSFF